MMFVSKTTLLALAAVAAAHGDHRQEPLAGPHKGLWYNTIPGDGGTQADSVFSGISTFGRLPYFPCLASEDEKYDIAFIGAPFDTGTSYRPGARFGPSGIRQGSRRLNLYGGYNVLLEANPFVSDLRILDCGDIPVTSYENGWAIQQIEHGHNNLLMRKPFTNADEDGLSRAGKTFPRIIIMGGDHTITLPLLRSINNAYGPVTVIHFDSHLDSWKPKVFGGSPSEVALINHGTYFYHAAMEGLLRNDTNIHAGIRTTLSGPSDYENDGYCGFEIVEESRESLRRSGTASVPRTLCISRLTLILWILLMPPELELPRQAAGRLANCALLSAAWTESTSSVRTSSRSLRRTIRMLSCRLWPLRTFFMRL